MRRIKQEGKHKKRYIFCAVLMLFVFGLFVIKPYFVAIYTSYKTNIDVDRYKESLREGVTSIQELILSITKRSRQVDKKVNNLTVVARIGVMSDSHGNSKNMISAVADMQRQKVDLIIHLGDFTAGGEDYYFKEAKQILDSANIKYLVMPGDHDFNWVPDYSRQNYEGSFGNSFDQVYRLMGINLILYDNSVRIEDLEMKKLWLKNSLENVTESYLVIFFSPRPLYSPYFSDKADDSGEEITELLKKSGVKYAIAGNTHTFAKYMDLGRNLNIITVGAVGEYKNPLPQWVLIEVLSNYDLRVIAKPIADL